MNNDIIWRQRKRLWCRLPWTFTIYSFSKDRFFVEKGVLSKKYEELRFYRVLDISMQKSFLQRIFGLGSIFLMSNDKDTPNLEIKNIPGKVKQGKKYAEFYVDEKGCFELFLDTYYIKEGKIE